MRWLVLTIGLLVLCGGLYVANQGTQILAPVAEVTGQMTGAVSVTPLVSSTLLSVPASNYTFLTVNLRDNVKTNGIVQVESGTPVGFYIMTSGNFTQWRHGNPSAVALAEPDAINYNFTFIPNVDGLYYFIFSNQDTAHKDVIFSLNAVTYTTTPGPIIQYAEFELMIVGILLIIVGIKTGKKKSRTWKEPVTPVTSNGGNATKCKFCGKALGTDEMFCPKCGRSQS